MQSSTSKLLVTRVMRCSAVALPSSSCQLAKTTWQWNSVEHNQELGKYYRRGITRSTVTSPDAHAQYGDTSLSHLHHVCQLVEYPLNGTGRCTELLAPAPSQLLTREQTKASHSTQQPCSNTCGQNPCTVVSNTRWVFLLISSKSNASAQASSLFWSAIRLQSCCVYTQLIRFVIQQGSAPQLTPSCGTCSPKTFNITIILL